MYVYALISGVTLFMTSQRQERYEQHLLVMEIKLLV
jgi:hypothetical protein